MRILLSWLGGTDLNCAAGTGEELGPLARGVTHYDYDKVVILNNYSEKKAKHYVPWLKKKTDAKIELKTVSDLPSPVDYRGIYLNVIHVIDEIKDKHGDDCELIFHLSPGTPAMQAIWIMVANTSYANATLIQSSTEQGVNTVEFPFEVTADFIGEFYRKPDDRLTRLAQGLSEAAPEFDEIIHQSAIMKRRIAEARRLAKRSVSILIEGKTGTGKEGFAEAIHKSSPRSDGPFIPVNCGAIPKELVQSELFGYVKGAFTGADPKGKRGFFEAANKGTIFLDEIGEMPLDQQVLLLRVLQEGEINRMGDPKPTPVDVRVIAATNRTIAEEVADGNFREDLLYRLAVGVIKLPTLRDRKEDIPLIAEHQNNRINEEQQKVEKGYSPKKLSPGAMNVLKRHDWPGNVRELQNVLTRASVWANGDTISEDDVRESLFGAPANNANGDGILHRSIDDGIDLDEIQSEVERHYLKRAMELASNNKTKAASLLGFKNYQTLDNRLKAHGLKI